MQDENALREVAKDCVHCGFCLPACPTYQLWAEEMDSPRGRIYLVNQILDGAELTADRRGALRPLPGLHGLHDRVPVGRAVRPAHRGGPGVDRGGAQVWRGVPSRGWRASAGRQRRAGPGRAGGHLLAVPLPPAAAGDDRAAAAGAADRARPAAGPQPACRPGSPPCSARRCGWPRRAVSAAAARPLPERVPALGHPAGGGRHAHRVRAVGVLPAGQRRDRPGARGRGLRRDHPARAGLLRRAVAALRPGGRGQRVRPAHDRHVRAGRRGRGGGQLGRLRFGHEGVRAAAARAPTAAGPSAPPR